MLNVPGGAAIRAAGNRRGILYLISGMTCLVLNDTLMKYVGGSVGLSQMVAVRGVVSVVMLLAVARAMGATNRLHLLLDRNIVWRGVLDSAGTMLYLGALMHLPIGNAMAIILASPLILALFAVFILGERPGIPRWLAIGAGFVGVLLVVQPKLDGFNGWALVCLGSTLFHSGRDLMTRYLSHTLPSILITLTGVVCVTLLAGGIVAFEGWQPIGLREFGFLAAAAALLSAGLYLLVNSMRHGELSVVAPFRYSGLLVALVAGFIVWGDVPSAMAWSGIVLLLAAGMYLLHDERRRRVGRPVA